MNSLGRNESKVEKDKQKIIQDRCQALLTQMLRDEDNKYCVDCDAKGPRWASWNLGIFLCIRCAGIHRNLGVHISKVKSVNLDSWTPEQVVSLQQMGNSRARAVYEATLPDSWRRPQTDTGLESFIRAKYQHKRYIAKEWVPPPLPKVNWDKEIEEEAERQKKRKKESKVVAPNVRKTISDTPVPPLPKPSSSPKTNRTNADATKKNAPVDLLGLDVPSSTTTEKQSTNSSSDDVFSNFLSAPPVSSSPQHKSTASTGGETNSKEAEAAGSDAAKRRSAEEESFFNQTVSTSSSDKKLTKDSILALYGSNANQTSMFTNPVPGGVYPQGVNTFQGAPPVGIYQNGVIPPNMMYPGQQVIASNPFFNMASGGQLSHQFVSQSEHDKPKSNDDLLGDFAESEITKLPQQMSCLSLNGGGVAPSIQQTNMIGVQSSYQPVGVANYPMSNYNHFRQTATPNTFSQPTFGTGLPGNQPPAAAASAGQTFTMHLWQ